MSYLQDQIMHQASILFNILHIPWSYCVKVWDIHNPNQTSIHTNCAIYIIHNTKYLHNHHINSLYTAYQQRHRDKKIKSHCITQWTIHWETKYQHTKPYNVYDHPNTIQKVENRNLNSTDTTSTITGSITMAWHHFSLWMQNVSTQSVSQSAGYLT